MIKVSVIVPVYNTEKYLPKCLDSLIAQTLKDIEIICINDASTDGSLKILQEYALRDNRIKIIDFKQNKGAGAARNTGIDTATGEYIGFVDSDDFVDLDFYEKLYNKTITTDFDIVKGNIKTYDLSTKQSKIEFWLDLNGAITKNKANFTHTFTTAIFKRKFILNNNIHFIENIIHFEDPYFTISAILCTSNMTTVNDVFYYYCNNPLSASRKKYTVDHAKGISEGAKLIINTLNTSNINQEHYAICSAYVLDQVICWCNMQNVSDDINNVAIDGLCYVLSNLKYLNSSLYKYFQNKKYILIYKIREQIKNKVTSNGGVLNV